MLGKITEITEGASFAKSPPRGYSSYEGYIIKTETSCVQVGIDNSQCCCEEWGYCHSDDELEDFIGAELLSVQVTDTALVKTDVPAVYEGDVMFVDINTNKGTFQIVLYNEHNGYYSHEAVVVVNEVVTEVELL